MAEYKKISHLLLVLFLVVSSTLGAEEEPKDLEGAEANGKLEIIKQIKKINDDGSYTIGYEADDGSFKIESRDVLGNIKGTYGYIDEQGEIKRVSYSSTNATQSTSERPAVQEEEKSVVQRIPKLLKTNLTSVSSTTRRPIIVYPNLSTPSSPTPTSGIQSIPRRRLILQSSTTTSTTTAKPAILSTVAPARILIQSRPLLRAQDSAKPSESPQIVRPEVHRSTTENPILINRLAVKNTLLDAETSSAKPVTEQPEIKSNLLRRQLNPDKYPYDPRQHVINLQQAVGHDQVDVYSGSMTTGTARPLFTTTVRPRILSSTTQSSTIRPTSRFLAFNRLKNTQETTTDATVEVPKYTTPSPVPVVQIPANKNEENPEFVAVRHPFHRGTIFVPINHFHQRPDDVPLPVQQQPREFLPTKEQYLREIQPSASPVPPVYIRRPVPTALRPMPVHVDENGYIREAMPSNVPMLIAVQPQPSQYEDLQDEVDRIKPPVSTRDFQKLLQQLIIRQNRLEHINTITRQPELFRPQYRQVYPMQVLVQRPEVPQNGPVQFVQAQDQSRVQATTQQPILVRQQNGQIYQSTQSNQVYQNPEQVYQNYESQKLYQPSYVKAQVAYQPMNYQREVYTPQPQPSYVPSKRMASYPLELSNDREEFLPVDVREMLLLRMLQLAINPALPVDEQEMNIVTRSVDDTTAGPEKKVRNVEILGEEDESKKTRIKRYSSP